MFFKKKILSVFIFLAIVHSAFSLTLYKNGVIASYYAEQFHGKLTSNGEKFNMYDYTCAHKSLPFNTVIRVTNLSNGKQVDVRVNDRGPFVQGREIDLSKAAAIKLGMIGTGTTKVKLEIVKMGPNTKQSQVTAQKSAQMMAKIAGKSSSSVAANNSGLKPIVKREAGTVWDIQLGAFSSKENAKKRAQQLSKAGFKNIALQTVASSGIVRVIIKEVPAEKVPELEKSLRSKGFTEYTVKKRK